MPPVVVIIAVLGSMMAGIATPTEASATGALGTVLLALAYRRLSWSVLVDSTMRTVRITAMILTIVACGQMFAAVFVGSGGLETLQNFLRDFSVGRWGLLFLVMFIVFIAGFMLEPLVIILMVVPITVPLIEAAGFDKVWFCVLFLVMLQTGYLTPPMAPSIFYLRGIAPPEITLRHMYTGIWPFIGLQLVVVAAARLFPQDRHLVAGRCAHRCALGPGHDRRNAAAARRARAQALRLHQGHPVHEDARPRQGGRRRLVRHRGRRDARPGGRIGLRQDHDVAHDPQSRDADRGPHPARRASRSRACRATALRAYRAKVQAVFQDPWSSLNPRMKVGRTIAESLIVNAWGDKAKIDERVRELLLQVGLRPEQAEQYPHEFSGGQRQRVALAGGARVAAAS